MNIKYMKRRQISNYQTVHIRLKPKQHEKLSKIQQEDGISISEQIRIAISKYIKQY
jgi:hypothetical protein